MILKDEKYGMAVNMAGKENHSNSNQITKHWTELTTHAFWKMT